MSRFERWTLVLSAGVTGATGLVYAWMKYLMTTDDPYAVINHPLQPLMLKTHIVAAPCMVFAFGLIFTEHVLGNWRSQRLRGRVSGISLVLISVPMIVSGYMIQTVTAEALLEFSIATHLVGGTLYLVGFGIHRARMRARDRRRIREARASDCRIAL